MTKPNSLPIKRDAYPSGYEDSLTKTMQEADDAIKNEQEEFAELTPADREANARTQKFVENLSREVISQSSLLLMKPPQKNVSGHRRLVFWPITFKI